MKKIDLNKLLKMENCVATEKYLNENPWELLRHRESRRRSDRYGMKDEFKNKPCNKDITLWLDPRGDNALKLQMLHETPITMINRTLYCPSPISFHLL